MQVSAAGRDVGRLRTPGCEQDEDRELYIGLTPLCRCIWACSLDQSSEIQPFIMEKTLFFVLMLAIISFNALIFVLLFQHLPAAVSSISNCFELWGNLKNTKASMERWERKLEMLQVRCDGLAGRASMLVARLARLEQSQPAKDAE